MMIPFIGDFLQHVSYILLLPGLQLVPVSFFLLKLFREISIDRKWKRLILLKVLLAILIKLIGILSFGYI